MGQSRKCARPLTEPENVPPPDYGRGRPLTLGERKSLARRPDRAMLERLLGDPHPLVIKRVLANPRLTEDFQTVLRLAAKRPCRPDVLAEIARAPRWAHSARVRLALILNPGTPLEIATPSSLASSRAREAAARCPGDARAARREALCREHLERRPPSEVEPEDSPVH